MRTHVSSNSSARIKSPLDGLNLTKGEVEVTKSVKGEEIAGFRPELGYPHCVYPAKLEVYTQNGYERDKQNAFGILLVGARASPADSLMPSALRLARAPLCAI
jgi:hypothetical protein